MAFRAIVINTVAFRAAFAVHSQQPEGSHGSPDDALGGLLFVAEPLAEVGAAVKPQVEAPPGPAKSNLSETSPPKQQSSHKSNHSDVVAIAERANLSERCLVAEAKATAMHHRVQQLTAKVYSRTAEMPSNVTHTSLVPHLDYAEVMARHMPEADFLRLEQAEEGKEAAEQAMKCEFNDMWLSADEVNFAMCPPGNYLSHTTAESQVQKRTRLRRAMCQTKAQGASGTNKRETSYFRTRSYSTYESAVWPKPPGCNSLHDEHWYYSNGMKDSMPAFRPDSVPPHMGKLVNHNFGNVEFHKAWKVASTAFPDYLQCEYGGSWHSVPVTTPVAAGATVAVAVREPLGRWISAVGELLERSINHYCPNGPCGQQDGFDAHSTLEYLEHTTSWYRLVSPASGGYDPSKLTDLIRKMVLDTGCNYYSYASEHFTTQSTFTTQNDFGSRAANLSHVMKLENIEAGLNQLSEDMRGQPAGKCEFVAQNSKACKPNQAILPNEAEIRHVLAANAGLMRELCLVYAQDFVCFDYELPAECKGMF